MVSTRCSSSSSFCFPFRSRTISNSGNMSKWSSMLRLLRLVTKIISSTPAATASSTIYCNVGLSTSGNISLGITLLAGRTRVPRPATGNTALRILLYIPPQIQADEPVKYLYSLYGIMEGRSIFPHLVIYVYICYIHTGDDLKPGKYGCVPIPTHYRALRVL